MCFNFRLAGVEAYVRPMKGGKKRKQTKRSAANVSTVTAMGHSLIFLAGKNWMVFDWPKV